MKLFKTFEQFVNERLIDDEIPQLQIVMRGKVGLTSKTESFTKNLMQILYDKYIHLVPIDGDGEYNTEDRIQRNRKYNRIRKDIPLLNFTSTTHDGIESMEAKVYNNIDDIQISASKLNFHKAFDGEDFVPKSVYKLEDIEDLSLPIIAKPSEGFSAQGIEKFDSYEGARNSELEFDIWQEAVDIDREFRAFIMENKIIHVSERITNTSNDMSVGKKDADEKIDLVYIDQDMDKFPHMEEIERIKESLNKKVNLEFYNIDLILDTDGKLWVPEVNGAPGIGPSMFRVIYKSFVEMAYDGYKLSEETEEELKNIETQHRDAMKKEYPKEYKGSLSPL